MNVYLDIETLPCDDPEFIADIAKTIAAPAQYKKPESIAEWLKDNKERAINDAIAKTSFDGMYGSIACVCFAFDDGPVFSLSVDGEFTESDLLLALNTSIEEALSVDYAGGTTEQKAAFVGQNIVGFDLPFLKHRAMILGVKPTAQLLGAMYAKPWDACIADTMLMWSSDSQKRVSMDKLCKAFGIPSKGDFDGSMVSETWPHDPQRVIDYCKADVQRTREIYKRMTFQEGFQMSK